MTGGAATVSTHVCVITEESVTACPGLVCVLLVTLVPHVRTGVQMALSAMGVSKPACVSMVPAVTMTQACVCVHLATKAPTVSKVRDNTMP